ncbi:MAG: TonB-dependent receptor [Chryseolinea sp.]
MTKFYLYLSRYLAVLLLLVTASAWSQSRTVSGKVTSSDDGTSLPGVNVVEKGTNNGTISNANGEFSFSVGPNATLVFSFVGYTAQEVPVGAQTTFNVVLVSDVTALSEVIVIGYGNVEAKDATGALVALKSENFNQGVIASPEQLMQGKIAGVQITTTSGEPGAAANIRIRGTSSVLGGTQPLYVIDGVPLSNDDTQSTGMVGGVGQSAARNPLNFMNPNDIENITVLKDASATAIYGSRGANGVILITTKKGKSGNSVLEYSASGSMSTISKEYDLLDRNGFLAGYAKYNADPSAQAAIDKGANTDWQKQVFRTAYTQNHNLSFGGGDKTGDYRFSGSYMNQQGIIHTSGLKRYTMRFNGTKKFMSDKLVISTQFTVSQNTDDNVPVTTNSGFEGDLIGNVLKANPTNPVYNPDGTFFQLSNTEPNPVAMLKLGKSYTNTTRGLGNISAEYEIIKGLKFKTVYGFDRSTSLRKGAFSRLLNVSNIYNLGRLYLNNVETENVLWENYLNYDKKIGSNLTFQGLLGYSYQSFNYQTQGFEFSHFRTDNPEEMINNLASADQSLKGSVIGSNSSNTTDELQSYFGRVNFNFSEKYLLTATLRADGSTRFGGNNKYGYFPSFAFKWRMSDEAFVPDLFDELSFRAGYGVTGNQQIPHNIYTDRQRFSSWGITSPADGVNGGGLAPVAFANPDLKWESTAQVNFGFDFGVFGNKIRGSLDFYSKNTTNLLAIVYAAQPASQPFVYKNLPANIYNKGFELVLEGNPIMKQDFKWTLGGNLAYNKSEVKNLGTFYNTGEINGQGLSGAYCQRIADGQPLFSFYVREFDGFDENGIAKYKGGDVQKFVGKSAQPKVTLGLNNTFIYKSWDLNFFFSGQFGQYVYSNTANAFFTAGSLANGRNATTDVPTTTEDKLNAPDVSTRFLYNASFVRLQNMTLGYNWKINSSYISNLRFSLTGQNLFVITDYPFQDPEVSINKQQTLGRDLPNIANAGIDYTTYPKARTFTFGINATF